MTTEKNCNTCDDASCSAQARRPGERDEELLERQALASRLCQVKHKILVMSGKGGVGKSTVAANLATALCMSNKRVGLLDIDIHGPSVPKLLHMEGMPISGTTDGLLPVRVSCGTGSMKVMSIGFLLRERDEAIIWRGPRKFGVIKQFLKDVEWGELDYLVIDLPPGTGDEPLAAAQLIGDGAEAIVVTTPQQVAVQDVRRCIVFCRQVELPVLGVVENMSGFTCPNCGDLVDIFGAGGGQAMAEELSVPYLGKIPIEPEVMLSGDNGTPVVQAKPHSEAAKAIGRIVRTLIEPELPSTDPKPQVGHAMRIALPTTGGVLSSHFGHCERFVLYDVDQGGTTIAGRQELTPPPHEPGTFPKWLGEQGATVIIAGGMGSRAQSLFGQNGIQVVVGASESEPDHIVEAFLDGRLKTSANICDH